MLSAKSAFFMPDQRKSDLDAAYRARIFSQILLRPREALRARIDAYQRRFFASPHGYNAIHLRNLEGGCAWRMRAAHFVTPLGSITEIHKYMPRGRNVTVKDICS